MATETKVKIPIDKGKITTKNIKGTTYVYYQTKRVYDPVKKYTIPMSMII